ncbi:MAG: hypothetical protein DSY50_05800 [Desulfobulbus sp.]|nr:MAG: hypothetical protein DSY50_05800 [Desulfobulbus sp.]RUM35574.1 MAG: hypothetical protein DSY58_06710 [Desulfobulbus sp.]RUM40200.1 MAG: hypothetical protein DSY70_04255 [Desulfobulbus sp.]
MARTVSFDRKEVLQKAMDVFWQEGYCKCSIASLVKATGLQPGSLYAAFASKEGLFLATLEYYGQQNIQKLQDCLETADSPLAGIKTFFGIIADVLMDEQEQRGCFLVNTVLELSPENGRINKAVKTHFKKMEAVIRRSLDNARKAGELASGKSPEILARYLMVNLWGLQVFAKTHPDREIIGGVIEQILAGLEG